MPIYRIQNNISQLLLKQPESGMGFQVLTVRRSGFVVFNATIAISLEELRSRQFSDEEYDLISGSPRLRDVDPLEIEDNLVVFSIFNRTPNADLFGLSFSETAVKPSTKIIPSGTPRSYYRYSPYKKDRRVDPKTGDFLPGTYATTYTDMHFVPSGFAAVGRYALPNPASAQFVSQIVTKDRPTLMGTATPNFGQAGGGVEVFFEKGATHYPGTSFQINEG